MLRLALAAADERALAAVYAEALAVTPIRRTRVPGPAAPAIAAALYVLHHMLELELEQIS
ncbi:hypothetical protein [Herbidospora daliensis]|uniref:hypothetical protein n=1 Tax=Herbidospora daliensis TaxID=295585 RepID=UPI000785C1AC|nr:hypothetical protein [Herbidospora daliensis]